MTQTAKVNLLYGTLVFAVFALLFSLAYWPVIVGCYGVSDDFMFLSQSVAHKEWTATWNTKLALGRPILGLLHPFVFSRLSGIDDFRYLRLLGILIVSLLAASCNMALIAAGWKRFEAFLWSLAAFTLPPFQVYVAWATTGFQPLAGVLAGAAWYAADAAFNQTRRVVKVWLAVASVVLLLVSLLTYQPGAMFFWTFAAVALFKPDTSMTTNRTVQRFVWYFSLFGTGALSSVAIWKTCLALFHNLRLSPGRSHFAGDLFEKASWFVQQPLTDALNLARLVPSPLLAAAVAAFISLGLLVYFRGTLRERMSQLAVAAVLVPLTYLPNLAISESWPTYRTKSALTALIALYVLFALWGFLTRVPEAFKNPLLVCSLGALAPLCLFLAATQVRDYFVTPQQLELKLLREHVASNPAVVDTIKHMHLSPVEDGVAPLTRYDEFGILSVAQSQATKPMLSLILMETRKSRLSSSPSVPGWR